MKTIVRLFFTTLGVIIAAQLVPGIAVASFWTALLVAVVLAILNIIIGIPLKILTAPLTLVTFGLFLLVVNALVFWAATFVRGFTVTGFWPAFWGALIVTIFSLAGKALIKRDEQHG